MNYLITGVSAGIGRALAVQLIKNRDQVWGIARRSKSLQTLSKELNDPATLITSTLDLSQPRNWLKLKKQLVKSNFRPQVVIFNAATSQNDFSQRHQIDITRQVFELNYFSILIGIDCLIDLLPKASQIILVSSSSALKPNPHEGLAYGSSKAAISHAFESLIQKYHQRLTLKIVYLGPVGDSMGRLSKPHPFALDYAAAANSILRAVYSSGHIFQYPGWMFWILGALRLLPDFIYLPLFRRLNS